MKRTLFTRIVSLTLITFLIFPPAISSAVELNPEQKSYFEELFRDTWASIVAMVEPESGLPFDSSAKQPVTSVTNVGLYMASIAIAEKTKLLTHAEALQKMEAAVASMDKVEKWRGFPRSWFRVKDLRASFGNEFSYGSHIANYIGGLTVAKATFPEMEGKLEAMLYALTLKDTYDEYNGWLKGGYNMTINDFAVFQPWGKWYYKFFAGETRLLSFYGISRGAFPPEHWKALLRTKWRKGDYKILASGYEEGGLFTHYMTGLFLDERKMEMGESQRNYAMSQMKYAKQIGAPVWGWSSCETPKGRYLGYGELKDEIVTPYASVLASIYFPDSAYENLKALEELGARKAFYVDGKEMSWGFRDSVNWQTKDVSKNVLLLDQAMIFLTLANLLHDGLVWETFQSDPHIQKGLEKIKPFETSESGTEEESLVREEDKAEAEEPKVEKSKEEAPDESEADEGSESDEEPETKEEETSEVKVEEETD